MPGTAVDTSLVIAFLLSWHEHHEASFKALDKTLEAEGKVFLPVPALVEAYSVLTRLPAPHRLNPGDALSLLRGRLETASTLVDFEARSAWLFLEGLAQRHTAGGAVYDAQIVQCAQEARADRLLTLNLRHFQRLKPEGLEILSPLG